MRMRPVGLLLVLVVLVLVAPASAAERFHGIPSPPHVTIVYGPCPDGDMAGCTDVQAATVYLDDRDPQTRQHELGHLADAQLLTPELRDQFERLFGLSGPWDGGGRRGWDCAWDGQQCPDEVWADAYAACRLGWRARSDRWESSYGYWPNARRLAWTCALMQTI